MAEELPSACEPPEPERLAGVTDGAREEFVEFGGEVVALQGQAAASKGEVRISSRSAANSFCTLLGKMRSGVIRAESSRRAVSASWP